MADNDEIPDAKEEIILSIRQDGVQAKCYGGSYFLIAATQKSDMPNRGTKPTDIYYNVLLRSSSSPFTAYHQGER